MILVKHMKFNDSNLTPWNSVFAVDSQGRNLSTLVYWFSKSQLFFGVVQSKKHLASAALQKAGIILQVN